jgi:hypothetical protein
MNQDLWQKILKFDFDNPPSEYGFSIRLANENFWTKSFTEKAIVEYKKFMYLAATSDLMVSPSEIIDVVWHQHLIFTQSYQDFCALVGKQIQHIPSTHNKSDFQKFKQAKERTIKFYGNVFGPQPKDIWEYEGMYESLNLEKAKWKLRSFIIVGILAFLVLSIPFYFLLSPIIALIGNPFFIIFFSVLALFTFLLLETYNRNKLEEITQGFDKASFIYELRPFELVYLQSQRLKEVIHGTVNELVENGTIAIDKDHKIKLDKITEPKSIEQLQTMTSLKEVGQTIYPKLQEELALKPVFWNTSNCMDAFKKYFYKSKKFAYLFYLNFGALSFFLMVALIRLATGVLREKPITILVVAIIILILCIIYFLDRLTTQVCRTTIPSLYKTEVLPKKKVQGDWQWQYFLLGETVLQPSFVPLVNYTDKRNSSDSSGSSSSCGSSCGSSCSSCGGCGGD